MFLDPLAQVVVDRLHHLHAARPLQSAAQGGLKGLPLLGGGHGRLCAEHCVNELLMELVRLPAVKQGVVKVGRPVIKGREQKAKLRLAHDLLLHRDVELVLPMEVSQLRRPILHRADAADEVAEHLFAGIPVYLAVLAPVGHIIGVGPQQDQIVVLPHVQGADDLLVKGIPGLRVLQLGRPQGGEQAVLLAVRHLLGGKHDVNQVPAQGAGQGLFQQAQVFFRLLLGHEAQGLVDIGDDLAAAVHIAAVNTADGALLRPEPAAQLTQLSLVHGGHLARSN